MYFPTIERVRYEGPDSQNPFAYRHYNADEVVAGKPMKEHFRFASAYWHTMTYEGVDPFGGVTYLRTWHADDPMQTARNRVDAFFEFLSKMGLEYFCFHDTDIAPFGGSLAAFFANVDAITDYMMEKMQQTGIKLLWNTANMFSDRVYVHGAASSCNADVFARAAAQIKKGLDIGKKMGAQNYVFWGGREGYESLLNTDMKLEQENIARIFRMAVDYAEKIGHKAQFLIEPKPKEPTKHQYDFDTATAMAFLQKYDLDAYFKFNLEANHATLAGHTFEHELAVARCYGALGSLDANMGDLLLGWDTDEFPTDVYDATLVMNQILENGGIAPGGLNFDARPRRTSFDMEDIFLAHIAGMDTFARALKAAAKVREDRLLEDMLQKRYASYQSGVGASIVAGKESLESLSEYALTHEDIQLESSHLEYWRARLNEYIYK